MPLPSPRRAATLLAALLAVTSARADESNFSPYHVGSRAAGMGGAFTALADDGSGAWYNPGGLAFVKHSQLSLAGSVYGVVSGSFADALGDGHTFKYSGLNTLPTTTAAIWKLGPPDGPGDVLSLSVFVPDAVFVDDRDALGSRQNAFFFVDQVQTVWAGLGWARKIGRLGVGATAYALLGTHHSSLDLTAISATDTSTYATVTGRTDETTYGGAVAVGARWDPTDQLHLGLSVTSPAFGTGKRRQFVRATVGQGSGSPPLSQVVNAEDLHTAPWQPLRVQAGVAATFGAFTVSGDVQYLGARKRHDDAARAAEGLDRTMERLAVVNGAIGMEYLAAGRFPIRAGFFTDRSASRAPQRWDGTGTDPNATNSSHIDKLGASFSIGSRSDHTSTDVGISFSGGTGKDLVPDNFDFSVSKPSTATQRSVYVFLGSSFEL
jgi:long-chain fatty acid transport protein